MRRATQHDVARHAGVSRATVSYVLNGRTDGTIRVSEETRRKILESIRMLGYRVNLSARSLKTNRNQLIAILVPDLGNPFYPMLIRGAQKKAHASGYRILIVDSFSSEGDEKDFLKMALDHIADGLILDSSYLDGSDIRVLLDADIPSVGIGPRLADVGIDTISIDQPAAVRALIGHLVSRGHSRIAHLAGDYRNINGKIRYEAFLAEMRANGLEVDERHILEGDFLREGTALKVEAWLASMTPAERPSALFAANDLMAIEAIKAIRKSGLRVPEDFAVCGFDNIPEAEYVEPPLTTVGHDVEAMGRDAVALLIDRIEGASEGSGRNIDLPFELLVRKSS
jgi:LacI family transcriptional regulator